MNSPDHELLRRFAAERSEPAFTELVERHVGLVYSAALRQVGGDTGAAEDVAQAVFADLARKAAHLTDHTSLTGWLYTSTRYLAANARREEHRRRQREQEAHMMDRLHRTDDAPDWEELRPVLDEAMHELGDSDREAVLLRFFQQRPLAEVGERLGIGENAARMRVDRALDRLRHRLARRGITSAVTALGVALAERTLAEVPATLPRRISRTAIAGAATGGGLIFTLLALMARTKTKLLIAAAVAALFLVPAVRPWFALHSDASERNATTPAPAQNAAGRPSGASNGNDAGGTLGALADDATVGRLRLVLVTADTGKPVPNVLVERGWVTDAKFVSQRDGVVRVTYPTNTQELRLTTRSDGFADTCLKWNLERGQTVPESYTVQLERSVPIGGTVVDADHKPVTGASVSFGYLEDAEASSRTESHEFGSIQITTDAQGRWRMNRLAADMLRRLTCNASHPAQVASATLRVWQDPVAEQALRAETHVFQLGRAVTVKGTVVDTAGHPVPEAKVRFGRVEFPGVREGKCGPDGSFALSGCEAGNQFLTAEAKGYAATTLRVKLDDDSPPFQLVLQPGALLRLRIIGQDGQPIPEAVAYLDNTPRIKDSSGRPITPVQVAVQLHTDAEGRAVWEEAPDAELSFEVLAPGYFRKEGCKVQPDGQEHTIALATALTVFGTVRDAKSGAAVPRFRLIAGWPKYDFTNRKTNTAWSSSERFWFTFEGGKFRQTFQDGLVWEPENPGYFFRFEAEGYAPGITRFITANEGEVRLDMALLPAATTTVTLRQPDGRAAVNASVALLNAGGQAHVDGTSLNPLNNTGSILLTTDRNGRFQLPDDASLALIVAAHPGGFATAAPSEFAAGQAAWTLQPWGKIEGIWRSGDQPRAGREIKLESEQGRSGPLQFGFHTAETDGAGRFHFEHVPPGRMKLTRLHRSQLSDGRSAWSNGNSTEVEVPPGETASVSLDGTGYRVAASIAWSDGKESVRKWQFYGSVQSPEPLPPMEAGPVPAVRGMKQFPLLMQPDGTLLAEDVEPGTYVVIVTAVTPETGGKPPMATQCEPIPLSVPEQPASGLINLGAIPLRTETGAH